MGSYPDMASINKLKSFQERLKDFSLEHFEKEKASAMTEKHHRVVRLWSDACSECQGVKQTLEEKLLEFDRKQKLQRFPQRDETRLKNDEASLQTPTSYLTSPSQGNVKAQSQQNETPLQTQASHARGKSVNIDKDPALASILTDKLISFPREHHSEADLRNVDLLERGERNRALGRSHSEGSCVSNFSPTLTGPSLSVRRKTSTSKPSMLLTNRDCVACHQDSFCSEFSNMKVEWIQIDGRDKQRISLADQDSQISRQESFCSSVSSPRQGWVMEEKSSRIYLDDENSGYPSRDPVSQGRLKDTSDCNSASELESSSNLL